MNEKEPLEQNIERLIGAHGGSIPMAEPSKQDVLASLSKSNPSQQVRPLYRRLAVAAAILLIATSAIVATFMLSNEPTKIPPELAQLSVEQLLALHYDPSGSSFEPEVIEAALRQALDRLAPADVIRIARDLNRSGPRGRVPAGTPRTVSGRGESRQLVPAGTVGGRGALMAERAAPPVADFAAGSSRVFPEVVEDSDLFVRARLVGVTLDVDAIKEALIREEMLARLEDFMNNYRVTIQLEVIDALPAGSLAPGRMLTVPTVLREDQLGALKEGEEYYFAMTDRAGEPRFGLYFSGVYPVVASNRAQVELWPFFADAQEILLFGKVPSQETIDYWVARLQGETLPLALEYMALLPDDLIPTDAVMDVIAREYANETTAAQANATAARGRSGPIFGKAITLLLRANDKEAIQRMLDLLDDDVALADSSILWRTVRDRTGLASTPGRPGGEDSRLLSLLVRMEIATAPGNISDRLIETYVKFKDAPLVLQRYEQADAATAQARFAQSLMTEIINQAATIPDEDVTAMLWEIFAQPGEFGFRDIDGIARLWSIVAARDGAVIRPYLEEFLADPTAEYIGVVLPANTPDPLFACERSAFEVLESLRGPNQLTHEELMSLLLAIYERHQSNRSCMNFAVNTLQNTLQPTDTVCIPILKELLLMTDRPHWAVPQIIAQRMPNPAFADTIGKALEKGAFNGSSTASLVAALYACGREDEALSKALEFLSEPLNQQDPRVLRDQLGRNSNLVLFLGTTGKKELLPLIEEYTQREYGVDLSERFRVDELRQNAIMALARLGGKSSIRSLRQLYDSSDIRVRITSALALCYLGDKTGEELLSHFADGTYRLVPDVALRWHVDLAGGTAFQSIIGSYLRNDRTDALWLAKLTHDIERADSNVESAFFRDHRVQILDIAVAQLDNPSRETREFAADILRNATGRNFSFHPDQYPHQQEPIIQRWRDYVDTEATPGN